MNDEQKQTEENETQFIDCWHCGKPVFLESTTQDDDLQTRYFYTCPFCGFSDPDVPVA